MHWGDDVLLLYLAPFFKPHFPKCGDPMLGVKANRSALEYISSKADELTQWSSVRSDFEFGHMKGVLVCTSKGIMNSLDTQANMHIAAISTTY